MLEQAGSGQSSFGYTGEQTDPTGLVFLRAQYYNPAVGRFFTADSIVPDPLRSIGWNRYAYVENNPIRYVDPSGHCGGTGAGSLSLVREEFCFDSSAGGPELGEPAGGGEAVTRIVLLLAFAGIDGLMHNFPLQPQNAYNQHTTAPHGLELQCLDEGYWPTGGVNTQPWSTLPFPMTPPYFGPMPGFPLERPWALGDNILTAAKASELRKWAQEQGYVRKPGPGPETWIDPGTGEWRLKLKYPSMRPGLKAGNQVPRYSARTPEGLYLDPINGRVGTRGELGHEPLEFD